MKNQFPRAAGPLALFGLLLAAPPSDRYTLAWADEFDGPLNTNEWMYRTGKRFNGLNLPQNVRTEAGRLCIDFKLERIGESNETTCGGIISKRIFGYGYFETRGKLHGKSGLHSSFWTMGVGGDGVKTPKLNQLTEIDGYEVDSINPKKIAFNRHLYVGSHKAHGHAVYSEVDTSAGDFMAGFEWLPGRIVFYINGKPVHTNATVRREYYGPQNQWFTALAWDLGKGTDLSALPGVSSWDYFRYYARDLVGANLVANGDFEFNQGPSFEKNYRRDPQVPVAWMEDGEQAASFVEEQPKAYTKANALRHYSDKAYQVTTRQHVPFLRPAKYRLSAWVQSSGGQKVARMRAYGHGGAELSVAIPKAAEWTKVSIAEIPVTGTNGLMLAFSSEAVGGQWLNIDAVELVQVSGRPSDELGALTEASDPTRIVIDDEDPGCVLTGPWKPSSLLGWDSGPSRYLEARDAGAATWTPELVLPGEYKVSFFKLGRPGNARAATLTITHAGGKAEQVLDLTEGGHEWVECGTYPFEKGRKGSAVLTGDGTGYLRADAVKFEKVK